MLLQSSLPQSEHWFILTDLLWIWARDLHTSTLLWLSLSSINFSIWASLGDSKNIVYMWSLVASNWGWYVLLEPLLYVSSFIFIMRTEMPTLHYIIKIIMVEFSYWILLFYCCLMYLDQSHSIFFGIQRILRMFFSNVIFSNDL